MNHMLSLFCGSMPLSQQKVQAVAGLSTFKSRQAHPVQRADGLKLVVGLEERVGRALEAYRVVNAGQRLCRP